MGGVFFVSGKGLILRQIFSLLEGFRSQLSLLHGVPAWNEHQDPFL